MTAAPHDAAPALPGLAARTGAPRSPRRATPTKQSQPVATVLPVARVAVDSGLPHLDRTFDYAVPESMAEGAQAGCRVRVRFAGRQVAGIVLERAADSAAERSLSPLTALVSPEPVLSPEIAVLARAVADRYAGSLYDVLRLALPPRHARVEAEGRDRVPPAAGGTAGNAQAADEPRPDEPRADEPRADEPRADEPSPEDLAAAPPDPGPWTRYPAGPPFLEALTAGRSPRAVWQALPGPSWPDQLAAAVRATVAGGRGALVVLPDARDVTRLAAALGDLPHVALSADLGPAERYRRWLAVRRGQMRAVIGTRAATFAPVADLGLVAVWDDGDDLHAEPRAPYPHVRDVLVLRAHLAGAAALVGGHVRTAEAQLLVESGWARALEPDRAEVRRLAPHVHGTSDDDLARDPLARAARLPAAAFEAARAALARDEPVLVQVPRRGYVPSLACARDGTPARCSACRGPLASGSSSAIAACRWCGHLAGDWQCPACQGRALRAVVVGARRTAEELGRAFPGVPVLTSGRDHVLSDVPDASALVVSTPGAEPVAAQGYGAVLLLDGWAALGRADLRAGEEALRRWTAAAALARPAPEGRVVVVADRALVPVQALIRWDLPGAAARELAARAELGFPPATRMAAVDGPADAVAELVAAVQLPDGADVLGPVPAGDGERLLLRVPRAQGAELAAALKAAVALRSARKEPLLRVELDPPSPV